MVDRQASNGGPGFIPPQRESGDRWAHDPMEMDKKVRAELLRLEAQDRAKEIHLSRKARKRPPLMDSILTLEDLDTLPETSPLIQGVLTQGAYGLITGRDSTYKTFIALDWSLCLATKTPWMDHAVTMPEGRPSVLYIAAEGFEGFRTRIKAWEHHYGIKVRDHYRKFTPGSPNARDYPDGRPTFHLLKRPVNLFEGPEMEDLINIIKHQSDVGFVVIDTLRRSSGRAEQNGSDMGVVIDNIQRIKESLDGGSVIVIAHTDKNDQDTRGSSLIEDDADVVWHSKRPEGERKSNKIAFVNRKMKDGASHEKMVLEPETVLESLVMVQPDPFTSAGGFSTEDKGALILSAIKLIDEAQGNPTMTEIVAVMKSEAGVTVSKAQFYKLVGKLIKEEKVVKFGTQYAEA